MTLYITSASFEDRCLALVSSLATKGDAERRVLMFDFRGYENVDPYLWNRARLLREMQLGGTAYDRVPVSLGAPLEGEGRLRDALAAIAPERVVLDVSTLPRTYLFIGCRVLADLGVDATIRYYRPGSYGRQLSRGVRRVQAVPGFEGDASGSGSTTLVLILGYEGYKALYAWEQLGASRTIVLVGDPPYRPEFLAAARDHNRELFKQLGHRAEIERLHTFDPAAARDQLFRLYRRLREEDREVDVTVCPLGTKPQSLAAFGLAYRHREVAVAYVSSLMYYTGDYSRGFEEDFMEVALKSLIGGRAVREVDGVRGAHSGEVERRIRGS